MFLFSRFFRFDVSHTPVIGRKRLFHLIETVLDICLFSDNGTCGDADLAEYIFIAPLVFVTPCIGAVP